MLTRRYMHEFGATRDHLANVALAFRHHANRNPCATMRDKPLTREQYTELGRFHVLEPTNECFGRPEFGGWDVVDAWEQDELRARNVLGHVTRRRDRNDPLVGPVDYKGRHRDRG